MKILISNIMLCISYGWWDYNVLFDLENGNVSALIARKLYGLDKHVIIVRWRSECVSLRLRKFYGKMCSLYLHSHYVPRYPLHTFQSLLSKNAVFFNIQVLKWVIIIKTMLWAHFDEFKCIFWVEQNEWKWQWFEISLASPLIVHNAFGQWINIQQ